MKPEEFDYSHCFQLTDIDVIVLDNFLRCNLASGDYMVTYPLRFDSCTVHCRFAEDMTFIKLTLVL